ncbi:MAG: hypothetical protein WHV44_05755 [Anaerolineales bacterium]
MQRFHQWDEHLNIRCLVITFIGILLTFSACGPQPEPVAIAGPNQPTASPTPAAPRPSPSPTPSANPTATSAPQPTPIPTYTLTATVWEQDPLVPALLYHQFADDSSPNSDANKIRLSDFRAHLETIHALGFVFVSLSDWLKGDLRVPPGKSPIILTMDDLFFNNQITLGEDGNPTLNSGIGVWWDVYLQKPDLGFKGALFANLGDKLYARPDRPDWEDKLARAIVWCLEHDLIPYNHTYTHARLDLTENENLTFEFHWNDRYLRELLAKAGRTDLIPRLDNIIALPYGYWPPKLSAQKIIRAYYTPEGQPMLGAMIADYAFRAEYIPAPYTATFDRFNLPRIVGTQAAMDTLTAHRERFPRAAACTLSLPNRAAASDPAALTRAISDAIAQGACPHGVYAVEGLLFDAHGETVLQITLTP